MQDRLPDTKKVPPEAALSYHFTIPISTSGFTHIEGHAFILPALIFDNMITLTFARRIVMVTRALSRMVMSVDWYRLICIGIPGDTVILPSEGNQPVLLTLRFRIVMLISVIRIRQSVNRLT